MLQHRSAVEAFHLPERTAELLCRSSEQHIFPPEYDARNKEVKDILQ